MIGRIYKIYSTENKEGEVYIGSTTRELDVRFREHYTDYCGDKTRISTSSFLFKEYGFDSCVIELVKEYEIIDKYHLRVYEQLWIEKFRKIKNVKLLNQDNPFCIKFLNNKEYYKKNKQNILEYQRTYYEENKDHILERNKIYREKNLQHITEIQKKYYEKNKEHISNYLKEYNQKNREKISNQRKEFRKNNQELIHKLDKQKYEKNKKQKSERSKEKIKCDICEKEMSRGCLSRHKKTQHKPENF